LFWLDAHGGKDLPLLGELNLIFQSNKRCIVIIDDFEVPGHSRYLFDSHNGLDLNIKLISPLLKELRVVVAFPNYDGLVKQGVELRGFVLLIVNYGNDIDNFRLGLPNYLTFYGSGSMLLA
jgi:hypothetical protein